jgi:hypothetical protein
LAGHLFLKLHGFTATVDSTLTGAGDDKLSAALFAAILLAYLIRHDKTTIL